MSSTPSTRTVGIYRTVFPYPSEAFITEQASNLRKYTPYFLMREKRAPVGFQHESISDGDPWGLKRKLFTLTRTPRFFGPAVRQLDLIHAHFAQDGVYAATLASELRVPLVITCHGGDVAASLGALLLSRRPTVYQYLLHRGEVFRKAARFIAVSGFIEKVLVEAGFPREKIARHYIGVDTARFAPAAGAPSERFILCVARHAPVKGISTLLRAFARIADRHRDVTLVQVGAGPQTESLEREIRDLGLSARVRLRGALSHSEVLELMRQAEVYATTSETADGGAAEALGIVFNEASACSVPVVATASGGIPEAVIHGETGLLAPERDDRAIATHLDALLSDRASARRMGARGREFVLERFDIRKQTAKLETIYDELAG